MRQLSSIKKNGQPNSMKKDTKARAGATADCVRTMVRMGWDYTT